jgi:hypothetical protein
MNQTNEKQLEQAKKAVLKMYPKAYLSKVGLNLYTIMEIQDDLSILDILEDQFVPPQETESLAWEKAGTVTKIMQNINRTHPLRAEFQMDMDPDKKQKSIQKRTKLK